MGASPIIGTFQIICQIQEKRRPLASPRILFTTNFMKQKHLLLFIPVLFFSIHLKAQTYDEQYEKYSAPLKKLNIVDSIYFVKAQHRDSCMIGVDAPEFHATTMDGHKIDFAALKGKVIFLNFWFTGCQPCIKEIPGFNKLVDTYSKEKVVFISITYNNAQMVNDFLKKHTFKFQLVADNDSVRRNDFKLFSVWPYNIIIGKDGKIAFMQFGSKGEEAFDFFNKKIRALL